MGLLVNPPRMFWYLALFLLSPVYSLILRLARDDRDREIAALPQREPTTRGTRDMLGPGVPAWSQQPRSLARHGRLLRYVSTRRHAATSQDGTALVTECLGHMGLPAGIGQEAAAELPRRPSRLVGWARMSARTRRGTEPICPQV